MRIAIVGASGQTGIRIIDAALARGHEVIGVARTPSKIERQHPQLEVRPADIFDAASLVGALAGAEAVITSVGKTNLKEKTENFSTVSHRHILGAMRSNGTNRIVAISSFGAAPNVKRKQLRRRIYLFLRRRYYGDMHDMENLVLKSGMQATIVRAPMLHNRPARNEYLLTTDGSLPDGLAVSRDDLASFMIDEIETGRQIGRFVALADAGNDMPPMRELMPPRK